jgi:hypothetical protein
VRDLLLDGVLVEAEVFAPQADDAAVSFAVDDAEVDGDEV